MNSTRYSARQKIIVTSLLLIASYCKAADNSEMEHSDSQFAIASQSMFTVAHHAAQCIRYY